MCDELRTLLICPVHIIVLGKDILRNLISDIDFIILERCLETVCDSIIICSEHYRPISLEVDLQLIALFCHSSELDWNYSCMHLVDASPLYVAHLIGKRHILELKSDR